MKIRKDGPNSLQNRTCTCTPEPSGPIGSSVCFANLAPLWPQASNPEKQSGSRNIPTFNRFCTCERCGKEEQREDPCRAPPPPPWPEAAAFILIYFRSEYPNKTSNCLLGAIRRRRERRKTETEEESEAGIKYEPGRLTSCTVTRTQLQRRGRSSAREVGQEQKSRPREDR